MELFAGAELRGSQGDNPRSLKSYRVADTIDSLEEKSKFFLELSCMWG